MTSVESSLLSSPVGRSLPRYELAWLVSLVTTGLVLPVGAVFALYCIFHGVTTPDLGSIVFPGDGSAVDFTYTTAHPLRVAGYVIAFFTLVTTVLGSIATATLNNQIAQVRAVLRRVAADDTDSV